MDNLTEKLAILNTQKSAEAAPAQENAASGEGGGDGGVQQQDLLAA